MATRDPAADVSIEERLAELEREREQLLAAAAATSVAEDEAVDEAAVAEDAEVAEDGAADDATEQPEAQRAAPARTSLPGARFRPGAAGSSAPPAPVGARRVGRVTPAPAPVRGPRPSAKGAAPRAADALDPADPSIPLERVPYVRADLRRVGVIAGIMVLLIIVADVVVSAVVK